MTTSTIALLALVGVLIVAVLWIMTSYNYLVRLSSLVSEAWSGIDVQLKRRYDLIPNLVETVKGYAKHEQKVFEQVAQLRTASMRTDNIEKKAEVEQNLTAALKTVFAVAESYPELKANENFRDLQNELSAIEREIQLARRYYNGTVRNLNITVRSFPSSLIAHLFGFTVEPFFEAASAEKERINVSF